MFLDNGMEKNRRNHVSKAQKPRVSQSRTDSWTEVPEQEYHFPAGLLGFSSCQRFSLERYRPAEGGDSPFWMLRSLDEDISFPLIHPSLVLSDYELPLPLEVLDFLRAPSTNGLIVLLIVTLRDKLEEITVNLQGPILLNPQASLGAQLVVENYPVRHPLLAGPPS